MLLLERIKKDQLQARKSRVDAEVSLLTTLIGEAAMIGKNDGNRISTDVEVVAVIQKFIKNNGEMMRLADTESNAYALAGDENKFLERYLPTQLSEEDIRGIVQKYIEMMAEPSPKMMGQIMKLLKDNYNGQYDGKLASKIVKELLNV